MPYRGDPIAERLDRLAERTGVPRFQRGLETFNPVRLRVLPLVLLALAAIGLGWQIADPRGFGYFVIMIPWIASTLVFQFGPLRRPWRGGYDEREAAVVRHGHFMGLLVAFSVAILGALAMALGKMGAQIGLWDIWAPTSGLDWMAVVFFLGTLEINVAVLAASNATPEPLDDDDE
jgi:hypothetical protein